MSEQTDTPAPSPELAGLEAEANAALAGAPEGDALTDTGAEGGELVQAADQPWEPFLMGLRPLVFGFALPQWDVTEAAQLEWVKSLAACCDQLFPGGPAGKYACYVRLLSATVVIGGGAMLANGGKLPPFGPKRLPAPEAGNASSAAA